MISPSPTLLATIRRHYLFVPRGDHRGDCCDAGASGYESDAGALRPRSGEIPA